MQNPVQATSKDKLEKIEKEEDSLEVYEEAHDDESYEYQEEYGDEDSEEEFLDNLDEDADEQSEYTEEELEELAAILVSGGEDQLAELESMTKAEIKEWADAFEFNVPLSLSKAEMIERFIEEVDENVESEYKTPTSVTEMILWLVGACLFGAFVLAPLLDYLLY